MKSDAQLKKDVEAELEWDPSINAAEVGVAVKDGVVTLSGHLNTLAEKHEVEKVVQRVAGVRAVAVELDVKLTAGSARSDSEIAHAVETAFKWHSSVPANRIQVKVEKGWVTLAGEVDWEYQRAAAANLVRPLIGVMGIDNNIVLKRRTTPDNIEKRIRDALTRQAEREAKGIEVQVLDSTVVLRGSVHSLAERVAAQGAAWSAPGITRVDNELRISP
ncbi:BON domain-containing protein [Hydrogenophaga sp. D2P1]|uniref:BON domain-containing protein n=1 Tax=Hydrogenophaga aromaticivorans TaxID=2610898 RepID=A0A7Y8GY61_9BURK|nr:BON domain-containing protein [Hydrogenophaga aromaticivorans]NWF47045.1 BON domain-containing protein [Hydrogenophaga aromaticivorans]